MAQFLADWLVRVLPGPQAAVLGIIVTALIVWNIANDLLVTKAMQVLDASYAGYDALFEESSPRPDGPLKWVDWYNNTCLHSAIGYVTPNEAEEAFYANLNPDQKAA